MVVSKKFLHFSKHHFPKDSESGLKSKKILSLSFLPDLNHPNVYFASGHLTTVLYFLNFSKHYFSKDSESGLKSSKLSTLSFTT